MNVNKQRGFLSWQLFFVVLFFALMLISGLKLGPHYIDHRYIDAALKDLGRDNPNLVQMKKNEIIGKLNKIFTVNNIRGDEAKSIIVTRKEGIVYVSSIYEVRVPFISNIDVVLDFKSQLSSATPELCCSYLVDVEKDKNAK